MLALGPVKDPLAAAVSGAMVGFTVGLIQWWALRPLRMSFDWAWVTAFALMVGSTLAWEIVSYSTAVPSLTLWGLIAGAVVGVAQAVSQRLPLNRVVSWSLLVSSAWGLAWFVSANVIVDAEVNYAVFGSTGALTSTALLAFFVNPVLSRKK